MSFKILNRARFPLPCPNSSSTWGWYWSSFLILEIKQIRVYNNHSKYQKLIYKFGAFPVFSFAYLFSCFLFSASKTHQVKFNYMSFTPWTNCICTRAKLHKILENLRQVFSPLLSLTVKSEQNTSGFRLCSREIPEFFASHKGYGWED